MSKVEKQIETNALKSYFHKRLLLSAFIFYECPDMNNGAQRARATNGRGCESAKCGAVGLRGNSTFYVQIFYITMLTHL